MTHAPDIIDFTAAFVSGSLSADDPMPSLRVPPLATERAFDYVDKVKQFMKRYPRRPPDVPYWVDHGGTCVPWFELLPGYADLVAAHELLAGTKVDPVQQTRKITASSRAYVGTAVLVHRYFAENHSVHAPRVLVIGAGNGVDLQRLILAKKTRIIERVDCLDISNVHAKSITEARSVSGLAGSDYFMDVLSPESPLNKEGYYDLVFIHMALHYVCTSEERLRQFMTMSRRCLRAGGVVVGTYPEAARADIMDGAGTFAKVCSLPPTPDRQWGGAKVSIDDKMWDDPTLPFELLVEAVYSAGMSIESWLLPETLSVHKQYVPPRMSDFMLFKELGYFRAFSFSATEGFSGYEPGIQFNPPVEITSSYPMTVETAELGINYGVPATSEDIPWLLHTDTYVKVKEDGQLGVLISADGGLYLRLRNGDVRRFPTIFPKHDWAVQVEVVGPDENPRYMLSDPLSVPGLPHASPFHARLKGWKSYRPSCPGALLVETGNWLPSTVENIKATWDAGDEGIVFQYLAALPVTYRSADNVRGSMRYLKKVWTADVGPRKRVVVSHAGNTYELDNTSGGCVKEFLLTSDGAIFNRDRLDKTVGNTALQLERLERVLSLHGVLAIFASKGVVSPPLKTPLPDEPSPSELAALILHTGDMSGKLEDVRAAKRLQSALRNQLLLGELPLGVRSCLESFGWSWSTLLFGNADLVRADVLGRPIDVKDPFDIVEEIVTGGLTEMFTPALAQYAPRDVMKIVADSTSTN